MFQKTSIYYTMMRTGTCAYQGVINVSFLGNFAYVINKQSVTDLSRSALKELLENNCSPAGNWFPTLVDK